MRLWWAAEPQGSLASPSVQALVRDNLHATPHRPRPSHGQKVPLPCPRVRPPGLPSSPSPLKTARPSGPSRSWLTMHPAAADCLSSGIAFPPVGGHLARPCPTRGSMARSMALGHRRPGRGSFSPCRPSPGGRANGGWTTGPLPCPSRCPCWGATTAPGPTPQPCAGRPRWCPSCCPPLGLSATPSHGSGAPATTHAPPSRPRRSRRCQRPCAP